MPLDFSHLRTWERSRPIKPRNHIISSDFGTQSNYSDFFPSFEKEPRPDIKKLLTMEYGRTWLIEREIWGRKRVLVDPKVVRNYAWVLKWKETQRKYRRADMERIRQRKLAAVHKSKKYCQNCKCIL